MSEKQTTRLIEKVNNAKQHVLCLKKVINNNPNLIQNLINNWQFKINTIETQLKLTNNTLTPLTNEETNFIDLPLRCIII